MFLIVRRHVDTFFSPESSVFFFLLLNDENQNIIYTVRVNSFVIRKRDSRVFSPTKHPHFVLRNILTKYAKSLHHFFAMNIILSILSTGFYGFLSASESLYESRNANFYFYDLTVINYQVHIISSYTLEVLYFIKTCIFYESLKINQ